MNNKGFTLFELLITLTLVATLTFSGIISYVYWLRKNEQEIIVSELKTAMQYARMQAVSLGYPVFLVSWDDAQDWSQGMRLNTVKNENKIKTLYHWQWHHSGWTIAWKGAYSSRKIIFSPNSAHAMSNGYFILLNSVTHEEIRLILNRLGRLRISNDLSSEH